VCWLIKIVRVKYIYKKDAYIYKSLLLLRLNDEKRNIVPSWQIIPNMRARFNKTKIETRTTTDKNKHGRFANNF